MTLQSFISNLNGVIIALVIIFFFAVLPILKNIADKMNQEQQ